MVAHPFFLSNPNGPAGPLYTQEQLHAICAACGHSFGETNGSDETTNACLYNGCGCQDFVPDPALYPTDGLPTAVVSNLPAILRTNHAWKLGTPTPGMVEVELESGERVQLFPPQQEGIHGYKHVGRTTIKRSCRRCGVTIKKDFYVRFYNRYYAVCGACMKQPVAINRMELPASLDKLWLQADRAEQWHLASLPEQIMAAGIYEDEGYRIMPGTYADVLDYSLSSNPTFGPDPLERFWVARGMISGIGENPIIRRMRNSYWYTIMPGCMVCGFGSHEPLVRLYKRPGLGFAHEICWEWFITSGAAEAEGFAQQDCGHWIPVDSIPPAPESVISCARCQRRYKPRGVVVCPQCQKDPYPHLCRRCSDLTNAAKAVEGRVGAVPFALDFDLFAALADFYILDAMNERMPTLAGPLFMKRSVEIAREMARYTIMATGGELRHYVQHRSEQDLVCFDPQSPFKEPLAGVKQSFYCESHGVRLLPCYADLTMCSARHWPITHTHFAEPLRTACCTVRASEVWINGVHHKPTKLGAQITKFGLPFRIASDRHDAWREYYEAVRVHKLPLLNLCYWAFATGNWDSSYGGMSWAAPARLVRDYVAGKIPPPVFIDQMFGVQHNGGSLFDKAWITSYASDLGLGKILDLRREMRMSLVLLPLATPPVWDLVKKMAAAGDAEAQIGAAWIKAAGVKDGRDMFTSFAASITRWASDSGPTAPPSPYTAWWRSARITHMPEEEMPKLNTSTATNLIIKSVVTTAV